MEIRNLTVDNFENEVMQASETILIDFWATWCPPCKMLSPIIDEVAKEMADVKVCKVNTDEQPALAGQFNIMHIPTLVLMKDGEEVRRTSGYMPKEDVKDFIRG